MTVAFHALRRTPCPNHRHRPVAGKSDILIGTEEALYSATAEAPGGWRGARRLRVARQVTESSEITSFYLEPEDGGPVVEHKLGQYSGEHLLIDGQEIRRNYSLSAASNGRDYRINVKREPGGVASTALTGCSLARRWSCSRQLETSPCNPVTSRWYYCHRPVIAVYRFVALSHEPLWDNHSSAAR